MNRRFGYVIYWDGKPCWVDFGVLVKGDKTTADIFSFKKWAHEALRECAISQPRIRSEVRIRELRVVSE